MLGAGDKEKRSQLSSCINEQACPILTGKQLLPVPRSLHGNLHLQQWPRYIFYFFSPLMLAVTRIDSGCCQQQRGRAVTRGAALEALQAQQLLPRLRG